MARAGRPIFVLALVVGAAASDVGSLKAHAIMRREAGSSTEAKSWHLRLPYNGAVLPASLEQEDESLERAERVLSLLGAKQATTFSVTLASSLPALAAVNPSTTNSAAGVCVGGTANNLAATMCNAPGSVAMSAGTYTCDGCGFVCPNLVVDTTILLYTNCTIAALLVEVDVPEDPGSQELVESQLEQLRALVAPAYKLSASPAVAARFPAANLLTKTPISGSTSTAALLDETEESLDRLAVVRPHVPVAAESALEQTPTCVVASAISSVGITVAPGVGGLWGGVADRNVDGSWHGRSTTYSATVVITGLPATFSGALKWDTSASYFCCTSTAALAAFTASSRVYVTCTQTDKTTNKGLVLFSGKR